jgi:hypothetical protein
MAMAEATVALEGLSKLDKLELERLIRFEANPVPQGTHGEAVLFTAYFAMTALTALAAYLLRKHDYKSFEETIVIEHPDGRKERRTVKWNSSKSEAPEADIIAQIRGAGL